MTNKTAFVTPKDFGAFRLERQHLDQLDTLLLVQNILCDASILIEKRSSGNDVTGLFLPDYLSL